MSKVLAFALLSAACAIEYTIYTDSTDCSTGGAAGPDISPIISNGCTAGQLISCDGTTLTWAFHTAADCSDSDVSKTCTGLASVPGAGAADKPCSQVFELNKCVEYEIDMGSLLNLKQSVKFTGDCPAAPCFSRDSQACRVLDAGASPADAFGACFNATGNMAERVLMADLKAGDMVLSAGKDLSSQISRVLVNQHRAEDSKRSPVVEIKHADGELSLTPDHVLLVDGQFVPARDVKVGSVLSHGATVTSVGRGVSGIINPLTANGLILTAGASGLPVISSTYPEWIAGYMLDSQIFPTVSVTNLLSYMFPENVQAYYDNYLEVVFDKTQAHLNALKISLPSPMIAATTFALDLLLSAGFFVFALSDLKVLATVLALTAVSVRRAKA